MLVIRSGLAGVGGIVNWLKNGEGGCLCVRVRVRACLWDTWSTKGGLLNSSCWNLSSNFSRPFVTIFCRLGTSNEALLLSSGSLCAVNPSCGRLLESRMDL